MDVMSVLQSSYTPATANSLFSPGSKFAAVDPTKWQGTWTGKDYKNQPFTFKITNVKGYRADVTFTSSAGLVEQKAFITTKNSFRIGDSSFTLTGNGVAKLVTIVIDPNTGIQTENTATANRKS
jgi:hypothetical protein